MTAIVVAVQPDDQQQQEDFEKLSGELVKATMNVYKQAIACLLPTPAKSHYIFNLRDFSRVVVGICLVRKDKVDVRDVMIRSVALRSLHTASYSLIIVRLRKFSYS